MIPRKIGRYEPVRVLGRGSMGVVYEARDPNLDRRVAIKTIRVDNLGGAAAADYEARFRTEARSVARLQHPNIVAVYDAGRDAELAFLVMEYVQGEDLKHHLDRGSRFTLEQSLRIIRELLAALDYAHQQGILHRDIKPANLLLEAGGRVKLTDFGVARIQDSGEATRTQGHMVGTLKYMAPEQVQGLKADARADLFSAGVLLYQLLTNRRPFDADNDFSIIQQVVSHEPPPPGTVNSALPPAIDAVVARALAKDPMRRFATAREFAAALQSAGRRAADLGAVPPPPAASRLASPPGETHAGVQDGTLTLAPTVTQELELVYWKDIKDSTDRTDFEAFLVRFPTGTYADLARKRLAKLSQAPCSADDTVLTGVIPDAGQARAADDAATLGDGIAAAFAPGLAARASAGASSPVVSPSLRESREADGVSRSADLQGMVEGPGASTESEPPAAQQPIVEPVVHVSSPSETAVPDADMQAASSRPRAQRAGSKSRAAVLAVLALLIIGGAIAYVGQGGRGEFLRGPAAEGVAADTHAQLSAGGAKGRAREADAVAAQDPQMDRQGTLAAQVSPTGKPAVEGASSTAPAHAGARRGPAASPVPAAARAGASRQGSSPVVNAVPQTPPAAAPEPAQAPERPHPPPRAEPRVSVAAGSRSGAGAAVEACRDRIFIARELCLADNCDKPGSRNHDLCVQWRRDKDLRENARMRQGPQ